MASGPLIGRDREVAEVTARLDDHRLVTLVGPGGAGKTTLAREVARRAAQDFPLGVLEVDLTRVGDEEAVPGALAAQLGFESFDALLSGPADQPALVLVDNCEHLLDAVATCVVRLLGACRQPTVLATSRSPLEVPGETVVSLAPLPVPGPGDDARAFASVQLFLERMRDAGVDPGTVDLSTVGELCRRLDGLPLALEIAAARTRSLGVGDILQGIAEGSDVLDRPRFRGSARHRSIDDAIRWSVDLLDPGAADFLASLAVFAGPFDAGGARAVADADPTTAERALDELAAASLIVVDGRGGTARYRLLETVRRFAGDRLRAAGRFEVSYDRYTDHVVTALQETLAEATRIWRPTLVRDLVASFDDLAEALRWCTRHDATPRRAFAISGALWAITHQAHADDIVTLVQQVVDRWPDRGTPSGASAVASLATAQYTTGHPERAVELAAGALDRLTSVGPVAVTLHRVLGQGHRALGELEAALAAFRAGAAVGHELDVTAMALELDVAAAVVAADLGDLDVAVRDLEAVIDRATELGSDLTVAWSRTALGWVRLRIDPVAASMVVDRALAESAAIDYPIAIAAGLRSRVYAHLLSGDRSAAVATARELVDDLLGRGAHSNARLLFDVGAVLAHDAGHDAWRPLVAATRSAPITTLLCARYELVPLPDVDEPPRPTRDSIRLMRQVLVDLASTSPAATTTRAGVADTAAAPAAPATPSPPRIRRAGAVVELTFDGHTVAVRASKGIADIVRLVQAGGREVHCVELAGVAVEQSSTGEVIDAAARRQYEQRIRDLQSEVDEAEADGDYARSYRYQAELDEVIEHLTAALGHGKRTRRGADTAERSRSAVTHRVRSAIKQVSAVHPGLGHHLEHAVNTGTYCSYRPEHPVEWIVE